MCGSFDARRVPRVQTTTSKRQLRFLFCLSARRVDGVAGVVFKVKRVVLTLVALFNLILFFISMRSLIHEPMSREYIWIITRVLACLPPHFHIVEFSRSGIHV